jgi:multidrug efflux system membrane fusion protein
MDRRVGATLLLIAAMAGVAGCSQASSQTGGPPAQPDPLVVYDVPISQVVTDYEDFPGAAYAIYTVEVRARVSGYLKRVYFQDGQEVKKGDSLFLIDPRPFQATLDRAKATLEQAEAHAKRLNNEYRRAKALYDQGRSVSREEFDRYAFDHAEAEAALSTAKANLDLAQLDLDWTNVTVDLPDGVIGRLGRRMVDPGNLIKADDTMMTSIVSQDPLYVYFDVHEQAMLRIRRLLEEGRLKAKSEKEVPVLISLSDEHVNGEPVYKHQGMVDFTDNRVDLNTGTLRFRAKISNPHNLITPGMFVKVRLPIGEPHQALLVREQSLQSDQGLKKVFVLQAKDGKGEPYVLKDQTKKPVLDKDGKTIPRYRPVTVDIGTPGVLRDGYREITKTDEKTRQLVLKPGDFVVAKGMQKIRLGTNPATGEPFLVDARAWGVGDEASSAGPKTEVIGSSPAAFEKPQTSGPAAPTAGNAPQGSSSALRVAPDRTSAAPLSGPGPGRGDRNRSGRGR